MKVKWSVGGVLISGLTSQRHSCWHRKVDKPVKFLCRMASVTPDLRLPFQPQSITAVWLVPNWTAWWRRHMGASNLLRVVAWWCAGLESNPRPLGHESHMLTTTPKATHNSVGYGETTFRKWWRSDNKSIHNLVHRCQDTGQSDHNKVIWCSVQCYALHSTDNNSK